MSCWAVENDMELGAGWVHNWVLGWVVGDGWVFYLI